MKKPILLFTNPASAPELGALTKAHVSAYTRKDGTFVAEHDDKRVAKPKAGGSGAAGAKPAGGDQYGHPNVVGHAEKLQGGDASKAHGMSFAGKEYYASGKEGHSMHDKTPVRHFREATESGNDDGQHVWMDHSGRVHADDTSEVKRLRGEYEAHNAKSVAKPAAAKPKAAAGKPKAAASKPKHSAATLSALADQHEAESERHDKLATKKGVDHPDYERHVVASAHHAKAQRHAEKARDAKDEGEREAHLAEHARYNGLAEKAEGAIGESSASKPLHHSDLKEGDELIGPDGEKHEYSHTTRGLGRMKIETRAGYSHPTEKDGTLPGWKKTGRNNMTGDGH